MLQRIAFITVLLATGTSSAEASKLDQSYVPDAQPLLNSTIGDIGNGDKAEEAQTFRVGVNGRLTEADIYLQGSFGLGSSVLLEIHRTTPGGLPSDAPGDLLGTAIWSPSGPLPNYQFVPFSLGDQGPMVTSGELLALVPKVPGSGSYNWGGAVGDPYADGRMATRSPFYQNQWSFPVPPADQADLGFRTYVEPVPEPSTFAVFLACGLGIVALTRRR
jgi:hypothetical protein